MVFAGMSARTKAYKLFFLVLFATDETALQPRKYLFAIDCWQRQTAECSLVGHGAVLHLRLMKADFDQAVRPCVWLRNCADNLPSISLTAFGLSRHKSGRLANLTQSPLTILAAHVPASVLGLRCANASRKAPEISPGRAVIQASLKIVPLSSGPVPCLPYPLYPLSWALDLVATDTIAGPLLKALFH